MLCFGHFHTHHQEVGGAQSCAGSLLLATSSLPLPGPISDEGSYNESVFMYSYAKTPKVQVWLLASTG